MQRAGFGKRLSKRPVQMFARIGISSKRATHSAAERTNLSAAGKLDQESSTRATAAKGTKRRVERERAGCVAPCGHPMRNPFCAGMTQTSNEKNVNSLRSATSAAQLTR